jgi:hypothetical protein
MSDAPRKEHRYTVAFEHYENAMLVEANLSWQVLFSKRGTLPKERREKLCALLARFVKEMKPEVDLHRAEIDERNRRAIVDQNAAQTAIANGALRPPRPENAN